MGDSLGRVNKLEVIQLDELKRPRIDVVVNCSGVFRDLFVNQMNLLDRAIKLAAEQDEPDEMNFVRKHATAQAEELGVDVRTAATRIFSNASGSYSSNVNLAVENSSWDDEQQLQEMYLKRKSFAFNSDKPGAGMDASRDIFEKALSTVDVTFQNLDSSEISLTDVSHYYDSDPTKLVAGVRRDGKMPRAYMADTTRRMRRCARSLRRRDSTRGRNCSTRSGTRACCRLAMRACARSRSVSQTPLDGVRRRVAWTIWCMRRRTTPLLMTRRCRGDFSRRTRTRSERWLPPFSRRMAAGTGTRLRRILRSSATCTWRLRTRLRVWKCEGFLRVEGCRYPAGIRHTAHALTFVHTERERKMERSR